MVSGIDYTLDEQNMCIQTGANQSSQSTNQPPANHLAPPIIIEIGKTWTRCQSVVTPDDKPANRTLHHDK